MDTIETHTNGGHITLTVNTKTKQETRVEDIRFTPSPGLAGQTIRAADAATKYNISDATISRWASRGLVKIVEQGPKLLILDELSIARAAAIFNQVKRATGSYVQAGYVLKRLS